MLAFPSLEWLKKGNSFCDILGHSIDFPVDFQ